MMPRSHHSYFNGEYNEKEKISVAESVSDLYSLNPDPDPAKLNPDSEDP